MSEIDFSNDDISPELKLLMGFCAQKLDKNHSLKVTQEIDWEIFIDLVKEHRLAFLTPRNIEGHGLEMSDFSRLNLDQHNQKFKFKMLDLASELGLISTKLEEAGIESIQLKGPVAAKQIFNDFGAKNSRDIDILIDERNIEKSLGVLLKAGYIIKYPYDKLNGAQKKYFKKVNNQLALFHPSKKIMVEIHWRLFANRHLLPHSIHELNSEKQPIKIGSSIVYGMGAKHLLIYLCIHGAKHAWSKLYWLLEVAVLLKKEEDIELIIEEAKSLGVENCLYQAMLLSEKLFHLKLTFNIPKFGSVLNSLVNYPLQILFQSEKKVTSNYLEIKKYRSQLISDANYKLAEQNLLSVNDFNVISLPANLFFLYYPLRPFVWFWRHFTTKFTFQSNDSN